MKSVTHKILDESNISRYTIFNPIINEIDEIMMRYITFYNQKYQHQSVGCVLKLLTITNHVRHIRINEKRNLEYYFTFFKNLYCLELIKIDIMFLIIMKCILLLVVLLEI